MKSATMKSKPVNSETVDTYLAAQPPKVRKLLKSLRETIRAAAPDAEEKLSYGMPYYGQKGRIAYFAAHSGHIGFYAVPAGMEPFKQEIKPYQTGKATLRFPFDAPLPLDLVSRIVRFRVAQNLSKGRGKK